MKALYMLSREIVRGVCIDYDFYNTGSNDEYENMFSMVMKNGGATTIEDIAKIAENIVAHTYKDYDLTVEWVAERLLNAAYIVVN